MTTQIKILPSRSHKDRQLPAWKKLLVNLLDCICLGATGLSGDYKTQPDGYTLMKW